MIAKIIVGGQAEKQGDLQVGDKILYINQRDITGMNGEDIADMFRNSGASVALRIGRRAGNIWYTYGHVLILFHILCQ